ncbi:hypothetical protein BH11PAT3_BH11PAT3_1190 [soil metagenome]
MNTQQAIEHLGFNEKEAKVYLALLELGQASVYAIAETSGLKRPTAYVIVEDLVKKGAVSQVLRMRKQHYKAKPPEELISEAENRLALVKKSLPEIKALQKDATTKPRVLYFEGQHGLSKTLMYGLKEMKDKEIQGFYATSSEETLDMFGGFKEFNDTAKELGVKLRGLAPLDLKIKEFRKSDVEYGRTIKTISSSEYSPTVSIEMGEKFVKIQDWENLQALIIENENITKTLKQIFELVWKNENYK